MTPPFFISVALAVCALLPAAAQGPFTLQHSIPAPPGLEAGANFGSSVAMDGSLTVVGAPGEDLAMANEGLVKVFDSATGALLWVLSNPVPNSPGNGSVSFGAKVAVSGTFVAVGAPGHLGTVAGRVYLYDLSSGTPTVPVATVNNPAGASMDLFGNAVALSGTRLVVGASNNSTGASTTGRAYVYNFSGGMPASPTFTLNNPTADANDQFGNAVAISGTRVAVGAWLDDAGSTNAGSVYVYDVAGGTPTVPTHTLNHPNPVPYTIFGNNDSFGVAVALSGQRVVVGTLNQMTPSSAKAYVYDLAGGTPTVPTHTLSHPGAGPSTAFGFAVGIEGTRVLVGAWQDDFGAADAGSAYVFDLSGGTPTVPVVALNNPAAAAGDRFGGAVAISSQRLVVGAPLDKAGAPAAGSAYLYNLGGPALPEIPVATLTNPSPATDQRMGEALAFSGSRLVVGVPNDDTGEINAGVVQIYDLSTGTPTVPLLTITNPTPNSNNHENFGQAVAASGNWVVAGTPGDTPPGFPSIGSAYIYDVTSGTPGVPVYTLTNPSPTTGGGGPGFGAAVAMAGNLVVVGARGYDSGGSDVGRAYIYDLSNGSPTVPVHTIENPAPAASDDFGFAVAISGQRVVVTAYRDDAGATDAGSAYVYDLSSGTPTVPVHTLNNPTPAASDFFGSKVALDGPRLLVGAPYDDTTGTNNGSAYLYDLSSGTPAVPVLTLNRAGVGHSLGQAVGLSGDLAVVSEPFHPSQGGVGNVGRAYVYGLAGGTPTVPVATLENPAPALNDQFGLSVAIQGTTVAIGTPFDDPTNFDNGSVYIFSPPPPEIAVELLPGNTGIPDGGSHGFGTVVTGTPVSVSFRINNSGLGTLILGGTPKVAVGGTDAGQFTVTAQPSSPVISNGSTTFTVQLLATTGGAKTATLTIQNNDGDEATYDIGLSGHALAFTEDSDGDGLNDASEFQMAALGFDWQAAQPALVSALVSNLNGAGYYTTAQVGAMNAGVKFIQADTQTGQFTIELGLEKSTNLQDFTPFPMSLPQTTINAQGRLEFQFTLPDNTAFLRVLAP